MKKVLQVMDNIAAGGIQFFVMNIYRNIDYNTIQFDFLVHHKYEKSYESEIIKLGGKVFYLPARSQGVIKNKRALDKFFSENASQYSAVHFHESSLTYIEPLKCAKKYGIPTRIMHSHNTKGPSNAIHEFLHQWNKRVIQNYATNYVACGEMALKWMFGGSKVEKDAVVIYNGIDISKFTFSGEKRKKIREELGIEDRFVVGHAGRFDPVKNHKFILEFTKELSKRRPETMLILAGTGRMVQEIQDYAKEINIEDRVLFLGVRNDVEYLYQGMDLMILPSLYEGFPVTAIEAEAAGVPCLLSSTITKEAQLKNNVKYMDLNKPLGDWIDALEGIDHRVVDNTVLYNKGFDIQDTVSRVLQLYGA